MKTITLAGFIVALLSGATSLFAADMPEMPPPMKEHQWLEKFVGEWETEMECVMEPGKPTMKGKGTESTRMLGGFWVIGEGTAEMEGMPGTMTSILTIGYDPQKSKYIGSWVDSMTSYLWTYQGSVDASGTVLTMETEGPFPMKPGISKFKEVTEFKSKDHRVFTSAIQGDDGKWVTMITVHARRKK